ncbi:MAG: hypothetical protein ACQESR_02775 [Planctomycetota bacterium]
MTRVSQSSGRGTGHGQSGSAREPAATVKTGKTRGVFVVAPSTVEVGREFDVSLKMLTDPFHVPLNAFTHGYPTVSSSTSFSFRFFDGDARAGWHYRSEVPDKWHGTVQISSDSDYVGPSAFSCADAAGPYPHDHRPIGKVGPFRFTRPGVHFITFRDPASGVQQTSNPICVTPEAPRTNLYWGDIHGHTLLTDGLRSPEEYYYHDGGDRRSKGSLRGGHGRAANHNAIAARDRKSMKHVIPLFVVFASFCSPSSGAANAPNILLIFTRHSTRHPEPTAVISTW